MLPTTGYFKNINCPYYKDGGCKRPYCHYRHFKKEDEEADIDDNIGPYDEISDDICTTAIEESINIVTKMQTYNPTPISELLHDRAIFATSISDTNRRHILPYLPERPQTNSGRSTTVAQRPPQYVPSTISTTKHKTNKYDPISSLNDESIKVTSNKKDKIRLKYTPAKLCNSKPQNVYEPSGTSLNYAEYLPSSSNSKEEVDVYAPLGMLSTGLKYKPSSGNKRNLDDTYNPEGKEPISVEYTPGLASGAAVQNTYEPEGILDCIVGYNPSNTESTESNKRIKLDLLDNCESEFLMIDDILMSACSPKSISSESESGMSEANNKNIDNNKLIRSVSKVKTNVSASNSDNKISGESNKSDKISSTIKYTKSNNTKHNTAMNCDTSTETYKKNSEKDKQKSKAAESIKGKDVKTITKESLIREKDKERSKKITEDDKRIDKGDRSSKHKSKSKDNQSGLHKSNHKSISKENDRSKHSKSKSETKLVSNSSEKKYKDKNKSSKSSSDRRTKQSSNSDSKLKIVSSEATVVATDIKSVIDVSSDDAGMNSPELFDDDDPIIRACEQIHHRFDEPPEIHQEVTSTTDILSTNRSEQKVISLIGVSNSSIGDTKVQSLDTTIWQVPFPSTKKRVAHATKESIFKPVLPLPRVNSKYTAERVMIERYAKVANTNRLDLLKLTASAKCEKTVAAITPAKLTPMQTVNKGGTRKAHIPNMNSGIVENKQPLTVLEPNGKNIPLHVRTKMLTEITAAIINNDMESLDLLEAREMGQNQEYATYQKCKTIKVYNNACRLAIGRLRKLGPSRVCSETPTKRLENHSDNLDRSKNSGSYSVQRKQTRPVDERINSLSESALYKMFKRHLLTEEQLQSNGFPRPYGERKGTAIFYTPTKNPVQSRDTNNYQCGRCSKTFRVDDDGKPLLKENCIYHAKKKFANRSGYRYGCCGVEGDSEGCLLADTHIINGFVFEKSSCGKHRIQDGFVQTFGKSNSKSNTSIYALDCEMCFTTHGVELIRVTVVNYKKIPVYERFVKPPHEILDYITEFSGVTAKDMIGQNTTLEDVQLDLMGLFSEKTILVGHSLDSDLSALKIIHSAVVDTSVSFPHSRGPPYKRSLKTLAGTYLSKIIQQNNNPLKVGHDSEEDAVVSLELMLHLIKEDLKSYID